MSNEIPEEFTAIGVLDFKKWIEPKEFTYKPRPARSYDVDIKIECCGICGSDVHLASGAFGELYTPMATGHEIIGKVVRVGDGVKKLKVGDRVGVGAQCDSCGECVRCSSHHENNCKEGVFTFGGVYKDVGVTTQGGYSDYFRANEKFMFKIPDSLESKYAAPLMCGGITGFRPLLTAGVKKGTRVGVSGIGGIGHMTILFAKALGAEVTAISRSHNKEELAKKLGADHFIATSDEGFETKNFDSLDVIVNTANAYEKPLMNKVLQLLVPFGHFIAITAPKLGEMLEIDPLVLLMNNINFSGSAIGSPEDIDYMLKLAAEHNIKPWVEEIPISETNVTKAWTRLEKGDVKFRFVLTDYDDCFK
ncbi:oxidoreductase activity protein [[Candida] boidinii]|nr:oxidoreductase activity protein [[Candida] boidinii]